jgi:hypothetical protein
MKGLIACIVGVALTASSVVTPSVIADENGEVHYWTSSSAYVPPDETRYVNTETGETVVVPADRMVGAPAHVYFVVDDPTYDLSGAGDQLYLIGDGAAFHGSPDKSSAVFAATGGVHEVAPVSAEYRQDWLAVAAGDRPVRTFTAPRSVMDNGGMAAVSTGMAYGNEMPDKDRYTSRQADMFRPVHHPRRKAYVHRTVHSAQLSADWRRERRHRASYSTAMREKREDEPVMTASNEDAVATAEPVVARDELGHEIFQIGGSWYMMENGDWFRAESWRGPFVHVKKGTVPREVRMSADHPSRMDND